jgi:ABC-2 type transport system ATP-binding protein
VAETLEIDSLTKRYGATTAVADLTFTVSPGAVTGFLGPNGAGKTTTLRALLGLVRPTAGRATIGGRPYAGLAEPTRTVGAVLEQGRFHPGRRGRDHLRVVARATGVGEPRVDEVLALVGLERDGGRRVKGYSLGMRQRLDIATALLGDPGVLILDEPANGLDPEGVRWLRGLLRERAARGGTILLSSHVLAEVQLLADRVVVIAGGRLRGQGTLAELTGEAGEVVVRSPTPDALAAALAQRGLQARMDGGDRLVVAGTTSEAVGDAAHAAGVALHELSLRQSSLEDVFMRLTGGEGL